MSVWELPEGHGAGLTLLKETLLAYGARRLPEGAVLIEDIEGAVQRMLDDDCEFMDARAWFRAKLRAACGEGT